MKKTIKIEMPVEFDNLVNLLRDNNYEVTAIYNSKPEKHDQDAHWTAEVFSGMRLAYHDEVYPIKAMFCTKSEWVHEVLSAQIAADCLDCFDKWRRCSIILPFPKNRHQERFLLDKLKWLSTKEGNDFSENFDQIREYPEEEST